MTAEHSRACCTIPPIISGEYETKGQFKEYNGRKTYVTGPQVAETGILFIYDIFGFRPQTLQGADILATSDEKHNYQVFMPDFFEGEPCDMAWYPPTDDDKKAKLGAWFATRGPPMGVEKISSILQTIHEQNPNIKRWAVIGFCWGGKVVSLTSREGTPWKVAVQSSPAMVNAADAELVTIPMLMIASKDEPAEDVKKYEEALKQNEAVAGRYEVLTVEQVHGFMTARGDLSSEETRKEYEAGYKKALEFIAEHVG